MKLIQLFLAACLLAGCTRSTNARVERAAAELRNADITWDGSDVGLLPHVTGPPARYLADHPEASRPYLLAALEDPNRFAAAHVLLTMASSKLHSMSASHWNGLSVSLQAHGGVQLHPEQRRDLQALWRAR